ncbi:hypothetical protein P691DRAFT_592925 [Macrolepiota fuliginosa MF-IS2]|uniref:Uncharacterized protein n=1 Tax=Macrolepiota fuliginosa MF-IS2 TaxID=1400762 RepID=A0A9P5XEK4_9AGAR|nr:hypothetical protein P691DRAFT_592925 [Macrolepiota fuliginosa MF-IS2]
MAMSKKRRTAPVTLEGNPGKRIKLAPTSPLPTHTSHSIDIQPILAGPPMSQAEASSVKKGRDQQTTAKLSEPSEPLRKRPKIHKLAPPRPFPAVAASASATGPRSAHKEGKNYICLTRKTSLGAYMRRCKNLIIDDGYKVLHLHAMGAAIPLLLQLSCALPPILPFSKDEIHTEITTGTVELQDEISPDDEDEDITYRTRGKSTLYVIMRIGDGQSGADIQRKEISVGRSSPKHTKPHTKKTAGKREVLVFEEPEQEPEDI